jgi:hypothetical protein
VRRGTALSVAAGTLLLLSGCGGAGSDQDRQDTVHFTAPEFSIDAPGHPRQSKQTVQTADGPVEVTMYSVYFEDSVVSMVVLPVAEGASVDLQGDVDDIAQNVSGQVEESEAVQYDGYDAFDARISATIGGKDVTAFTRVIDIHGSLLQLLNAVSEPGLTDPPESWTTMLDSLEIG